MIFMLSYYQIDDLFAILGLWVPGLAVSHFNESNCNLWVQNTIYNDKSAILLHPGTSWNKNFASQRQYYAQKMQDVQVLKLLQLVKPHTLSFCQDALSDLCLLCFYPSQHQQTKPLRIDFWNGQAVFVSLALTIFIVDTGKQILWQTVKIQIKCCISPGSAFLAQT